jgi:UDP-N-acetyl-D-glucosamine dehydrogenase
LRLKTNNQDNSATAAKAPTSSVSIVGLGYVGLPLALQFARTGHRVLGIDVDPQKVDAIRSGRSYLHHIPAAAIAEFVGTGCLDATTDFACVAQTDAVIICVPTPLNKNREPDISYVIGTGRSIAPHLKRGMLVVLESTTYPGTTDEDLRDVLEEGSGMKAGVDFHLAYSPEREDPGNPDSKVARIPKVVGGYTNDCLQRAVALYGGAVERVVPVSSCRVAEATKLLENIFRSVNIALVNELKVIYAAMGIDVWEVISAAKTKPFGYMPFYPGPGLGGHCIPIDPFYLTWKAREFGHQTRFIELAGEINTRIPEYVISRCVEALNSIGKAVRGSRILMIGLAYKPNVDDLRESPTFVYMDHFARHGATVEYYDPYIPEIGPSREHMNWRGKRSVEWTRDVVGSFDLSLILTNHSCVDYSQLTDWSPLIVDTRNVIDGTQAEPHQLWRA